MFPSRTVLIAERDPAIMDVIVELLTDEGYATRSASTGLGGLAAIVLDRPALTLYDMALLDLSAGELIGRLRAQGLTDVRLVLMSTLPQRAAPLLVPGSIDCLAKPFDLDTILGLVALHVGPIRAARRDVRWDRGTMLASAPV